MFGGVMPARFLVVVALVATMVAACSVNSGPQTIVGATSATSAPPVSRVALALDEEDKRRANAAQTQALETGPSGAPVPWRNPDSGHYGDIVPGPAYQASGATCRQFTDTIFIDGKPQATRGTACRNPDGTWTNVN
jgi:surface antigen